MFTFKPFKENHLVLFRHWLNQDHVKKFWQEDSDDDKLREKFIFELPRRGVWAFVIEHAGQDIGYIQCYEAAKVGGGWWLNERPGTFGIDLIIGIPELLGQGLGPKIIEAFISFVKQRESNASSFIIDPSPKNASAIRAFEKSGFVRESEIDTPGGPAVLMRMLLKDL